MHTIEQISAFVAVYDCKSYSQAGRQLVKDRTTVRELVKALEDATNLKLINVEGRAALPTEEAEALIEQFRLVLRQNDKLLAHIQTLQSPQKATLTVAYNEDFPIEAIQKIEQHALNFHPEVRVSWLERSRKLALDGIVSGEIDLAIMPSLGLLYPEKTVDFMLIGYVSYGIYVGEQSALKPMEDFTLEDIQLEIQYVNERTMLAEGAIQRFSSHSRVTGGNLQTLAAVERNGWAVLPNWISTKWGKSRVVKKHSPLLSCDWQVPFSLFYQVGKERHRVIQDILSVCSDMKLNQ